MSLSMADAADVRPFLAPRLPYSRSLATLFGRGVVRFEAEGRALEARLVPPADDDEPRQAFGWTVDGVEGELVLPAWLVRDLLHAVEPAPRGPIEPPVAALLLELALAGPLDRLEAVLGSPVRLRPAPDAGNDTGQDTGQGERLRIGIEGGFDGVPFLACLQLPPAADGPLLHRLASRLPPGVAPPTPPVLLAVRLGLARLDLLELRGLAPGDALVVTQPAGRQAVVLAGERLAAFGRRDGTRVTLEAPPRPLRAMGLEDWTMSHAGPVDPIGPEDGSIGSLAVTLVFELGRRTATVAEVQALRAGHVVELDPLADRQVAVLANGRRIAEGELVQVGEAMAVRLTRLAAP